MRRGRAPAARSSRGRGGEPAHAAAVGEVERAPQRLAGGRAAVRAAQRGAELDQRADVLELRRAVREQRHGPLEQRDRARRRGGAGERAQRGAARAREAEALGQRELLARRARAPRRCRRARRAPRRRRRASRRCRGGGCRAASSSRRRAHVRVAPPAARCCARRRRARLSSTSAKRARRAADRRSWPAAASAASAASNSSRSMSASTRSGQRPDTRRAGATAQLESRTRGACRLGVADLAACTSAIARMWLPLASAISQPRGRATSISSSHARARVQLVVDDQHDISQAVRPPTRARRRARPLRAPAAAAPAPRGPAAVQRRPRHGRLTRHSCERRGRLAAAGAASRASRDRRRCRPAVGDELGLEPGAQVGRDARRPASSAERQSAKASVEVPGEPERAGAAQGDRAALDGRDGGGDRLVQQRARVGVASVYAAERQAELEPHVGPRRASGGGSASARRRYAAALCGAPRAPARVAASRSAATASRLARRLRAQQVQRDALRVGTLAREQRGGARMPQRPLAGPKARVRAFPRSAGARASARGPSSSSPAARSAVGERAPRRRRRAGERRRVPQRRAGPEDGERARELARALGQPRELALHDARRPARGRTSLEPRGGLVVRAARRSAISWSSSAPSRNGLPPVTAWQAWANAGARRRQPLAHQRLRRDRTERCAVARAARVRAASSSFSSSGAAAGSPDRTAQSTPIAQLAERARQLAPASAATARRPSARRRRPAARGCARRGCRPARPARARRRASRRRRAPARPPRVRARARPAPPRRPSARSHSGRARNGSNSWRADTPGGVLLERAAARVQHGRALGLARSAATAASRLDLPIPAGPSTTITRPDPARVCASRRPNAASSVSRSSKHTAHRRDSTPDGGRAPASREKIVDAPHDARASVGSDDRGHDDRPHG